VLVIDIKPGGTTRQYSSAIVYDAEYCFHSGLVSLGNPVVGFSVGVIDGMPYRPVGPRCSLRPYSAKLMYNASMMTEHCALYFTNRLGYCKWLITRHQQLSVDISPAHRGVISDLLSRTSQDCVNLITSTLHLESNYFLSINCNSYSSLPSFASWLPKHTTP
jgi:hypothetical protein